MAIYDLNKVIYSNRGVKIGKKTIIYNCLFSNSYKGDEFEIGCNCTLTGASLFAHDASPTVFISELSNDKHPVLPNSRRSYRKKIVIGDNVFVGYGSIILPGVTIGSNVVIGAGSVVSRDVPDNVVAAGNPCVVVHSIEHFIEKHKKQLERFPGRY